MRRSIVLLCALASVAGCNQSSEQSAAANNTAANAAEPKRPSFCFFKPEETKDWKVSVAADGKVTVTGKGHVKDSRYRPQLGQAEIEGKTAKLPLSITTNMTGYGTADDWWDVSAAIPAGLDSVSVTCGDKSIADLPLKKG
jgi:hypothetical protein